jgi:hypothetical protein
LLLIPKMQVHIKTKLTNIIIIEVKDAVFFLKKKTENFIKPCLRREIQLTTKKETK